MRRLVLSLGVVACVAGGAGGAAASWRLSVISAPALVDDSPAVGVGADGRVAVSWVERQDQRSNIVVRLAVRELGGRFSRPQALSTDNSQPDPSPTPAVVVDGSGQVVAVWSTDIGTARGVASRLVYRVRNRDGRLSRVRILDQSLLTDYATSLVPLTGGRALLVYERAPFTGNGFHGGLSSVWARTISAAAALSAPIKLSSVGAQINGANPYGVEAVGRDDGSAFVVWGWSRRSTAGGRITFRLDARRLSPAGSWAPVESIPDTGSGEPDSQAVLPLVVDHGGDVLIGWVPTPDLAPSLPIRAVWYDAAAGRFRQLASLPRLDAGFGLTIPSFALTDGQQTSMLWSPASARTGSVDQASGSLVGGLRRPTTVWGPYTAPTCRTEPFCPGPPMEPSVPSLVATDGRTLVASWYATTSYTVNAKKQIAHSRAVRLIVRVQREGSTVETTGLPNMPAPLFAGGDELRSTLQPDGSGGAYDAFLIGTRTGLNRLAVAHITP